MTDLVPAADVKRLIDRITVRRLILGLTQYDVADALGVVQSSVSVWESGRSAPIATNLASYARLVGLRLAVVDDAAAEQTAIAALGPDDPSLPEAVAN